MLTRDQATALVVQLYAAVLGRAPDAFGDGTLVPLLLAGYDPAAIRTGLAFGSAEAAGLVAAVYTAELGRAPEADGLALFLNALAGGLSLDDVRASVANSPEASGRLTALYQQVLNRAPDAPGLAQFTLALGHGLSLSGVRGAMAGSPEAGQLTASAYQAVLGRPPTGAEAAAAASSRATGATQAQITSGLAAGPESQARLAAAFEGNFGVAPSTALLTTQQDELALGRSFADTTQAINVGSGNALTKAAGYVIPAPYSDTGSAQTIIEYHASDLLYDGSFTTVPVPTTGAAAGPDTILLDVYTTAAAPLSFIASLDGKPLGSATVNAPQPTTPFTTSVRDEAAFSGNFGAGLHQLHLQVTSDPAANALVLPLASARFDGNTFLLGTVTTDRATGAADIFPHSAS